MLRTLTSVFLIGLYPFSADIVIAKEPFRPTITVSGTAEIRVVPDEVVLSISVESRKAEAEQAFDDNDTKIRSVISLLKESGVAAEQIRTEVIEITPLFPQRGKSQYAMQRQAFANEPTNANPFGEGKERAIEELKVPKPLGYFARRGLAVRILNLEEFENIYRGLIKSGVNSVEGISFQTSKLRAHRDKARLQAVRAAREKADAMAKELGCRVAAVDRVVEQSGHHYGRMQNRIITDSPFGDGGSDSLATGMMEITASVQVVFLLSKVEIDE